MKKKSVIILGCTGSIGKSALAVIRKHRELFTVAALSAHRDEENLLNAAEEFGVKKLSLSGKSPKSPSVGYSGKDGLQRMIEETGADVVLNGIAGSPGLLPSVYSLKSGKDLALANKETIVMAGRLIKNLAVKKGREILPVDSEHSAVFHLIKDRKRDEVSEIILTGSGGAFRDTPIENLASVTVEDALSHPTWNMGKKITIDSATMANKGLEVIEAGLLFDMDVSRIKVLIHQQSHVHSLIRTMDGSLYAQISRPDMQLPIQNALTYPSLEKSGIEPLDLAGTELSFINPDEKKYPMLKLAYRAAESGNGYPLAYNAANEEAVKAFIDGKIAFTDIYTAVESVLCSDWGSVHTSFSEVEEMDGRVRVMTSDILSKIIG